MMEKNLDINDFGDKIFKTLWQNDVQIQSIIIIIYQKHYNAMDPRRTNR